MAASTIETAHDTDVNFSKHATSEQYIRISLEGGWVAGQAVPCKALQNLLVCCQSACARMCTSMCALIVASFLSAHLEVPNVRTTAD
jgi:hypothetical protein